MSDGRIDAPAGEGSRSGLQYGPKDRSRAAALVMDAKKIFPQREDSLEKTATAGSRSGGTRRKKCAAETGAVPRVSDRPF